MVSVRGEMGFFGEFWGLGFFFSFTLACGRRAGAAERGELAGSPPSLPAHTCVLPRIRQSVSPRKAGRRLRRSRAPVRAGISPQTRPCRKRLPIAGALGIQWRGSGARSRSEGLIVPLYIYICIYTSPRVCVYI